VIFYREHSAFNRATTTQQQKTNLYVSGLPNGVSEVDVRALFEEFGTIRSVLLKCPVMQSEATKHITSLLPIYSMAYVNFESEESALAAFALNKRDPMSQIKVAYYDKQQPNPAIQFNPNDAATQGSTNYRILFITKINRKVTEEELKTICAKYGTVQSVKMMMGCNKMGQSISLGKATVAYSTADEASTAMQKLYFESSLGDYISVDFYKSREARLEQDAQSSDFTRMLTQYSQRYQNSQTGYGRGRGGYQDRGGYNNN
jgi:RNA recognition motif-containing protein